MVVPAEHPPALALTVGDPAGIGPEIALSALADPRVRGAARLVVAGPERCRPAAVAALADPEEVSAALGEGAEVLWLSTPAPEAWALGQVQEGCGRAALAALRAGHELAFSGAVDALVTGPVHKEALALAGEPVEGQTELLARWCGVERYEMLAVAGGLRIMLLTRHTPLARAIAAIRREAVLEHLRLLDEALAELGIGSRRLALAALNPHAGEGGRFGDEERVHLAPALAAARAEGLDVAGPLPADSVFVRAAGGEFDGVLALYHDQAFIPIKLLGRERGLTVIHGLPYLRVSPTHGTAFDRAGTGTASPENLVQALLAAAGWARGRRARGAGR